MAQPNEEVTPLLAHQSHNSLVTHRGSHYSVRQHCKAMTNRRLTCYAILSLLAILLVLTALLGIPYMMAAIYRWVIDKMMVLDPSSPLFTEWETPDIPMLQSFYFFDIQNPEEFKAGGKPQVVERGPYVYKLLFDRPNLTFYDNSTLSFYPRYFYTFNEELSVGPESDRFITLNMPLVTVAYFVRNYPLLQIPTNLLMESLGERLTLNLTVEELLWGYEEPLFKLIQPIISIPGYNQGIFGFLLMFNYTTLNLYTVNTGKVNQTMLNEVENYQGMPELPWWGTPVTNEILGTDGTMYHPYLSREEDLYLFHPDLCRSVQYIYEKDTVYKEVPLLKYVLANYTYDNGTTYPPNAGFCSKDQDLCGISGTMRQDPCRFGSPSAISNPHFFQGDPALYEAVGGLNPQPKYHQHYMEIEPLMGMPYVLKMRLQISMKILPIRGITEVKHIRDMTMPVLWFEQSVEADDRIVGYYEKGFVLTAYIALIVKWVMFSIGVVIVLLTAVSFVKRMRNPPVVSMKEKVRFHSEQRGQRILTK